MSESLKQIKILTESERAEIYGFPQLTHEERLDCFALSCSEMAALEELRAIKSKAWFILQLGYFKLKHTFFYVDVDILNIQYDLDHIMKRYFDGSVTPDIMEPLNKRTRLKHRQMILKLCCYRELNATDRKELRKKARQVACISSKPVYIFRVLMECLAEMRVELSGYRFMQDMVSSTIAYERHRLCGILKQNITAENRSDLETLLENSGELYEITKLRKEPRDYSHGQIQDEIRRRSQIHHLYQLSTQLLPRLNISRESIRYYASLVSYYTVFRLKRLNIQDIQLYLLCFVYHRFQKANDNLIGCFLYQTRHYWEAARNSAKERIYNSHRENSENIKKAGKVLGLFADDSIDKATPFGSVQEQAFSFLDREKLVATAKVISGNACIDESAFQWGYLDTITQKFKKRLRPLLQAIDFTATNDSNPLIKAIDFLKTAFEKGISRYSADQFHLQGIPKDMMRYLYGETAENKKVFFPDRYEFMVYHLLRNHLEARNIFCRNSVRYRSLEDDLLDNEAWKDKETLISEIGSNILRKPIREHLAELRQFLESRIINVNSRIASGENKHFQTTKTRHHTRWTLQYLSESDPINHTFFDYMPQIDISSILAFAQERCDFMAAFDHVLGRYTKQDVEELLLTACLIAWGTNMGLGKMGVISDIRASLLSTISQNFLRLETIKAANDCISNATAKLGIFRHYDIGAVIHSSSDGQKFETQTHTIRSRHSSKYFGLKKGISAYSLTANNVPINATLFGANEHESHYVFDLIYNNSTDIQPEIHSTDTHGSNQVNFALLHVFGYQFAPRYKDIYDTVTQSLCGFRQSSQYGDIQVKPVRKINEELIVEEWDNIQRIMVSLAKKVTTQNIIVGKLSSHARKNKTRQALWEYDAIIRSLYLLNYIDSLPLRRNIQKAVNRTESYHKLRRAIAYANGGRLRYKTESDQELWNESSRLIANCIIHYNATILSDILEHYEAISDKKSAEQIKRISPIAWQHINLYGRYEFRKKPDPINTKEIVLALLKNASKKHWPINYAV